MLLLSQAGYLGDVAISLVLVNHVGDSFTVTADALLQEGPRLGVIPAAISSLLRRATILDNLLHDRPEVGGKLKLVVLERVKDFLEVLRG